MNFVYHRIISNSRLNSLINFCLVSLFLTNLWIIIYLSSIDYFFFAYRPIIKEIIYGNPLPNPEPYEISLYIIFSLMFVFAFWLFFRFIAKYFTTIQFPKRYVFMFFIGRCLVLLWLLSLLVSRLGSYPLAGDQGYFSLAGYISPYSPLSNNSIYWLIFGLYLIFALLITLETKLLQFFFRNRSIYYAIIYATMAIIIALITFEARFSIPAVDSAFFFGPVWEISHGKTIITDVPSWYGFLSVLFFVLVYKLTHVNYLYLPLFIWFLYVVEYIIIFYLILKVGKSIPLALLGLFSVLTVNYFSLFRNPQTGPFRWAPLFIALYLFFRFKRIDSKRLLISIAVLTLWNIDAGIALLAAYIFTTVIFGLTNKISWQKVFFTGIFLFTSLVTLFAFIDLIQLLSGGKIIDLLGFFLPLQEATLGRLMRPMETNTFFWLILLLYFSSIIYFFRNIKNELILFSANLMLFVGNYYVGRSIPHNIINISPFIVLTFFLLVASIYHHLNSPQRRAIGLATIFFLMIVYPGFKRKEYLANEIIHKYERFKEGKIFSLEMDQIVEEKYSQDARLIRQNLKDDAIIIVSTDDTYLFYLTGKKNRLNINPAIFINTKNEMDISLKNIDPNSSCPKKIAVDCQVYKKCPPYNSITRGWPNILPILLNSIETKCQLKYVPITCTDKLCIAQKSI